MTKDFLKDMVKYLPAQIAPAIVGFISIPVITRLFPPADYGNYSLVMATLMIFTTLLSWLLLSITRFYPVYERDKKLDIFYGNIFSLSIISIIAISLASLVLLVFAGTRLSSRLHLLMYLGIGVFIVTGLFEILQNFLRVERKVNWYSGFAVWRSIGTLGIALLMIFLLKRGVESLLLGAIICTAIVLPILWKKAVESAPALRLKIDSALTKEMAKYGFPLVAGNLAAWILTLSDRYILEFCRGSQEVGIYSAGYNISARSLILLVTLFMIASRPISMSIWEKKGETRSKQFISNVTRYYLMACVPAVIGLSVLSKPIMKILTGAQYFEGYRIIPFVAAGALFFGLQQVFHAGFLFHKRTSYITFGIVAAGALNLLLNVLLIPKYGYFAAAVSSLSSHTFLLVLMVALSLRLFIWKFPFVSLVKVACASAIMGIAVYFLHDTLTSSTIINVIISVFIGGLTYLAFLVVFREFRPEEKKAIKQIIKRCMPCRPVPEG